MAPPPMWKLKRDATSPSVFISYMKNKKILEQIKQMLEFIDFEYEVGVEWETGSTPLPEKVFNLMRKCNCAVINVSAEEQEKRKDGSYGKSKCPYRNRSCLHTIKESLY